MNNFKDKRTSLERFVKEQIIGPGAYNKRYFFLEKWSSSEFSGKILKIESAINNIREVIPEVPAYQYSSAILFPETRENFDFDFSKSDEDNKPNRINDELDNPGLNTSADDDYLKEDTSESVVSKQQNYPNSLGLTFVVGENNDLQKDLLISLSFRKYVHIKKKECFTKRISIWVSEYETDIESSINNYFNSVFTAERIDENLFISTKTEIKGDSVYEIDYSFLNKHLEENVVKLINSVFKEKIVILKEDKGVKYFGLKDYNNLQFYSLSEIKHTFSNVFTLADFSLLDFVKKQLEMDIANYSIYKELIKQIEIYNQLKDIVTNLKSIFKENEPTPIWESKQYSETLTLPIYENYPNIYRQKTPVSIAVGHKEIENLKYTVQYITYNGKIFIKIILINTDYVELKNGEPRQLNKKDKANLKSYFGVELKVEENLEKCLKQYNPPQLLDIDKEDSFNKLLYRKYIDFGEGYNTSVNWGVNVKGLHFISTDFLPEQETPKVDYRPSKINGKNIESRISNEQVLSMRYLSSLTFDTVTEEMVLEGLSQFIEAYNIWIGEKQIEIDYNIEKLDDDALEILNKQIKACSNDYKRLLRNIELLRNDKKAMAAFRLMNTAMFMQLHHSWGIKESKKKERNDYFKDFENNEDYYKNTECFKFKDYEWRSFQLAFILLNIDAFVKPEYGDITVEDVFKTGWPERNEIADLVWFPTGGGKTEAYLGIIAFTIAYRRFTKGPEGFGTTVLMRYTLRMLTLQQFQRATLLICALEVIRKDKFKISNNENLGDERITIGLFVGGSSLPNSWADTSYSKGMCTTLSDISNQIGKDKISTALPFTDCPWCGGPLFIDKELPNIKPNHTKDGNKYGQRDQLNIACNSAGCSFHGRRSNDEKSIPFRLFDEDIYKFPPTLLFGTVDKFAAFANKVSTESEDVNRDSQRLVGKGYGGRNIERNVLPPELIIQDELHLLLGPLGSSVGLFEKSIDALCSYIDLETGIKLKPKIVTSTATTRNTDKQIFALFNRRSEIFPKQGIFCDDSFFAFYERNKEDVNVIESNRKYIGVLPIGKTQVWMQLRVASITLTHRLKYLKEKYTNDEIFENPGILIDLKDVFDYYHTVLAYFNSLKDVGKTQSQLSHYLPGDVNYVTKNTISWSFLDKLIRNEKEINYSELTGRLTGEEVKTNLSDIEKKWSFLSNNAGMFSLNSNNPPEFVIATNMISVGIDVSRFNTMIISSMPRNVAEYIQASSRVARDKEGIVFTIHHPLRSRDISHYQKFKEFHEKFYSYVEPISVTPFASKALDRYLAMYVAVLIRHNSSLGLRNNDDANKIDSAKINDIKKMIKNEIQEVLENSLKLDKHLKERKSGVNSSIDGIISQDDEVADLILKLDDLLDRWIGKLSGSDSRPELKYRNLSNETELNSLFIDAIDDNYQDRWKVSNSLREIGASIVIKTVQQ